MMTISSKGRYAARIMVHLASVPTGTTVTKHEIAAAEGISAAYVEQLMLPLRLAGLIKSHRGRAGGFSLAREPETVTIADVLRAVEGPVEVAPCNDSSTCGRAPECPTRGVWQKASTMLDDLFSSTTIADLSCGRTHEALTVEREAVR